MIAGFGEGHDVVAEDREGDDGALVTGDHTTIVHTQVVIGVGFGRAGDHPEIIGEGIHPHELEEQASVPVLAKGNFEIQVLGSTLVQGTEHVVVEAQERALFEHPGGLFEITEGFGRCGSDRRGVREELGGGERGTGLLGLGDVLRGGSGKHRSGQQPRAREGAERGDQDTIQDMHYRSPLNGAPHPSSIRTGCPRSTHGATSVPPPSAGRSGDRGAGSMETS